jgi:TPR repeat protein
LGELQALIAEEEAWNHRYTEGDGAAAVRSYLRAARLNLPESCAPCGPIEQAADTLLENDKYEEAAKLYSKILQAHPKMIASLNGRGYCEVALRQAKAAFKDFSDAAELGSAYAQDMLGKIYLAGSAVPHDRQKAIEWLTKAVAQGYEPSIELLEAAKQGDVQILQQPGDPQL